MHTAADEQTNGHAPGHNQSLLKVLNYVWSNAAMTTKHILCTYRISIPIQSYCPVRHTYATRVLCSSCLMQFSFSRLLFPSIPSSHQRECHADWQQQQLPHQQRHVKIPYILMMGLWRTHPEKTATCSFAC